MSQRALRELAVQVGGTPLEAPFAANAEAFLKRHGAELAQLELPPYAARGLARLLASNAEFARYLSGPRPLLARLADGDAADLGARSADLAARAPRGWAEDLELFVDELRLFRRDEMAYVACLDLSGEPSFEDASLYLSVLAERTLERALEAARASLSAHDLSFAVLGLGKLAGRELSYHSDLDLIFLYGGDTEQVHLASRLAQRMIHYLSTPTGAGIAYAIDARLRPSGRQGTLVTSYDAYARYQSEQAQTWEHLAVMRCRALAGDVERAAELLDELQAEVRSRGLAPWHEVADLRERIAEQRAGNGDDALAIKAGRGGIMDVDFLAKGALLERGASLGALEMPAIPAMLAQTAKGPTVAALLEDYRFLRLLEARARWVAGRPVEVLDADSDLLAIVAELVEPGLDGARLLERTALARARVATACARVLEAGSISALED